MYVQLLCIENSWVGGKYSFSQCLSGVWNIAHHLPRQTLTSWSTCMLFVRHYKGWCLFFHFLLMLRVQDWINHTPTNPNPPTTRVMNQLFFFYGYVVTKLGIRNWDLKCRQRILRFDTSLSWPPTEYIRALVVIGNHRTASICYFYCVLEVTHQFKTQQCWGKKREPNFWVKNLLNTEAKWGLVKFTQFLSKKGKWSSNG